MRPMVCLIAAMADEGVIGIENRLPWHLPDDLKHFRALTTGHYIIMGRKTFDSIGRLLPGRTSIVVTRNPAWQFDGCRVARSLDDAIEQAAGQTEVFVIGGAELFELALQRADRLYLTRIHAAFAGDAWFPTFNPEHWMETSREAHMAETSGLRYDFVSYARLR